MKLNLFQQNPQVEKYKPDSATRQIQSMDLDRKEELERFRSWMEGTAKVKSDLPDQKELDELNKQTESGKGMSLGLLGVIAAIPIAGIALGGGFGGLTKIADDAMKAITGGGNKPNAASGDNNNLLGLDTKDTRDSAIPTSPDTKGPTLEGGIDPAPALDSVDTSAPKSAPTAPTPTVKSDAKQTQKASPISSPLSGFAKGLQDGSIFGEETQKRFSELFKGKNPLKGFLNKVFGSKEGRSELGKLLTKFIKRIPLVGSMIGTLVDVFIFGNKDKKTQVKSDSTGLGEAIFGGLVKHLGPLGSLLKNVSFKNIGQWFGTWLYGMVFSGGASVVPSASNQSIKEMLFGKKGINPRTGKPYSETPGKSTTEPPDSEPAAQPLRGPMASPMGTGNVNQWLHGNPNRAGYDAGHAGSNAHDHFSFNSRAAAVAAYKALKAAGYQPYEFEGYGDGVIYNHSSTGGHYGPVGGPYTPGDTSDGTAFDIPWSSYGSGPITQKDYDLSYRAAQIVGAVNGGGANNTGAPQPAGAPPDYAPGRAAQPQQQQPNMFDNMMKTLEPLTQIFQMLGDKEYMDSLVLNEDGTVTTKKKQPKPQPQPQSQQELFPGMQSVLDTIEPSRIPKEVSMLTPEAEAAQERVLIIDGGQNVVQTGGQDNFPQLSMSKDQPNNNGAILIGAGSDPRELHRLLMSTKIG